MDLYSSLASVSATASTNTWTITGTIDLSGVGPGDMIIVGSRSFWGSSTRGYRIETIDRAAKTFTTTDNAESTYSGVPFFIRYAGSGIAFLPGMLQTVLNRLDAMFGISSSIFAGGGTRFMLSRQTGASALAELMFSLRSGDTHTAAFFLRQRQVSGAEVLDFISTVDGTTEVVVFRITRAGVVSFPSSLSTVALQAESLNTGPLGGLRNLLINGSMDIWQRGTSGTSGYLADRWFAGNTTSVERSTDVPDARYKYSIEIAASSEAFPSILSRIESINCRHLVGKRVRLSFWAKNVSGSSVLYCDINSATAEDNWSGTTNIASVVASVNPSSSWTRYSIDFGVMPSGAANGLELLLIRNNASASTTRITGVQLEIGEVATNYEFVGERGGIASELARCQRYYRRINTASLAGIALTSSTVLFNGSLDPNMRVAPTLSIIRGDFSSAALDLNAAGSWISSSDFAVLSTRTSPRSWALNASGFSGLTVGSALIGHGLDDALALSAEM